MRQGFSILSIAALTVLLGSCNSPMPDLSSLTVAVEGYHAALTDAMTSGNSEKSLSFIEENGLEMAPNMPMANGKKTIREMRAKMMSSGMKMTSATFTTMNLEAGGKIAYETGVYKISMTAPQMGNINDSGKYIFIWRQQEDKSWKSHAQIWNSDSPMAGMQHMEHMSMSTEPTKSIAPKMEMSAKKGKMGKSANPKNKM